MAPLPIQLHKRLSQFTSRYRNALLANTGLICALGASALLVLAWRLHTLPLPHRTGEPRAEWGHLPASLSLGIPIVLAVLAAGILAWWICRRWISPKASVSYLDRALGLQQRLVTVEEMGRLAQPPELYPLLIEDTAQRCDIERARIPKVVDRTAIALAIALLLLLVSLRIGHMSPVQLAQLPSPSPSPFTIPPPPDSAESQPSPQSNQQQQQGSGRQPQGSNQQQSSNANDQKDGASSSSSSSHQRQQEGQRQPPSQASGGSSSNNGAQPQDRNQQQQPGQEGGAPRQETGNQEPSNQSSRDGTDGSTPRPGDHTQQPMNTDPSSNKNGQSKQNQSSNNGEQRASRDGAQEGQADRQGSQQERNGQGRPQAGQSPQQAGQGGAQSTGDQEALKAEIQQLLKDVSGELQQLQTQLDDSKDKTPMTPGTGSDPQLYESPMAIDPTTGRAVPIQLKTDPNSTASKRQSGGVGTPSGEASNDAPTVSPQDAQLSEKPLQESATSRQTVPFEYRDVFGRLHRRSLQTGEIPQ